MCESKLFMERKGGREKLMDEVILIQVKNGVIRAVNLTGEEKLLNAKIKEIDFDRHQIILME
ncbi:MAG: CooT family nickel-binding protein [Euryarchaeota archaeon]|nr:CooT family nickel-binding protein [Euryarchaeota archaeon]